MVRPARKRVSRRIRLESMNALLIADLGHLPGQGITIGPGTQPRTPAGVTLALPRNEKNPCGGGCRMDGLWSGGFGVFGWGRVDPGSGFRQLRFGVGGL